MIDFSSLWIFFFFGYFSGSIPFGLVLVNFLIKIDIRKFGSGNIGTTNVFRIGNKLVAIGTLFLDILKGFFPVWISLKIFYVETWATSIVALAPILGHIFPVWIRFKGGKGIATLFGVLIALSSITALILILLWSFFVLLIRISSLSSLITVIFLPLILCFFEKKYGYDFWYFFIIIHYRKASY